MVSPARRRDAVAYLCRRHKVSERRACRVVGQHRSTQRYVPQPDDYESQLVVEMNRHAAANPRWGYRMIHSLLVADGWAVNRKRIERLWRLEGHRVPPARKKRWGNDASGVAANAAWNLPSVHPNHVWSYDFVTARTVDGGPLRILNIVDEFTRECVGSYVARSIGAHDVRRYLERSFARWGKPTFLRSDNGREFTADSLVTWLVDQDVTPAFVEKASPQQNCFVERFNGTMRNELLNGELFHTVTEARVVIADWADRFNHDRPHRGHRMKTPAAFAAAWIAANGTRNGRPASTSNGSTKGGR